MKMAAESTVAANIFASHPSFVAQAVKELNEYVKVFSADENAWLQLLELYQASGKLDLAKFCCEELLLIKPENYTYHTQYAELLFSLGSSHDMELARQYYAQALELKPDNNLRALYGLCLSLRSGAADRAAHMDLYTWATDQIRKCFKEGKGSAQIHELVEKVLALEGED